MGKVKYISKNIGHDTWLIEQHLLTSESSAYLVIGQDKAILIDTCMALDGFAEEVKKLTDKPIEVLCTHAHLDHIGSNRYFDKIYLLDVDKELLVLQTTPSYLNNQINTMMPGFVRFILKKEFDQVKNGTTMQGNYEYIKDGHIFDLGNRKLEVIATPGHTKGSICVLDRENRQLFSGDMVCDKGILLHMDLASTPDQFLASMEHLKSLSNEYDEIWPGHHLKPIDVSFIDEYIDCAKSIVDVSATIVLQQGTPTVKHGRIAITLPKQ